METKKLPQILDSFKNPFSSSSKDAIEMYEKAVIEFVSLSGDPLGTIEKALTIDPDFFLANVFRGVLSILSNLPSAEMVSKSLSKLKTLSTTIWREKKHREAFEILQLGDHHAATLIWEEILIEHPTDILALKFAHHLYFDLGESNLIRDSVARVFKAWKADFSQTSVFGYIKGMYSFGLEESGNYTEANEMAKEAIERNSQDSWAIHAITHVFEMEGKQREGIQFLEQTKEGWQFEGCSMTVHNAWHKALFYLELGQRNEAFELYDKLMMVRKSVSPLDLVDCSSFLFRCQLANVDVENRWKDIEEVWNPYLDDHYTMFNDAHAMMVSVGNKDAKKSEQILKQVKNFASSSDHEISFSKTQKRIAKEIGIPVLNAIQCWGLNDMNGVVNHLLPLRNSHPRFQKIGGSFAQRDLFSQLFIQASVRADQLKLASSLLSERLELKPRQPQSWKTYEMVLKKLGSEGQATIANQSYLQYLK